MTEDANVARSAGDLSEFRRNVAVVLIFGLIGPLIGGSIMLTAMLVVGLLERGIQLTEVPALMGLTGVAFSMMPVAAYAFGAVVAALTGLIVALSRTWSGRTTIVTPVAAAVASIAVGVLLNATISGRIVYFVFPDTLHNALVFLAPSLIAAIVCWLIARKWRLA